MAAPFLKRGLSRGEINRASAAPAATIQRQQPRQTPRPANSAGTFRRPNPAPKRDNAPGSGTCQERVKG
eukprot:11226392-Lingulodinium_polyedra.AAC.1